MATVVINQDPQTNATVLTTELNSLGTATDSSAGSAYDNTSTTTDKGAPDALAELVIDFDANPTAGTAAYLYAIAAPDGTNYGDANSTSAQLVAVFPLRAISTPQRVTRPIGLPPCLVKFMLRTDAAQTTASTGNTVKILPWCTQAN